MLIGTLWLAQVAAFAAGLLGPWRDPAELHNPGRVARPIRIGISFSLLLGALLVWAQSDGVLAVYAGWICAGMAASFVGDLIMARLIPVPVRLIGGMVAFAVGHACYIKGYAATLAAAGHSAFPPVLWLVLLLYGAGTVLGWQRWIQNPQRRRELNIGALVYGAWIAVMAAFAFALAWTLGGGFWLAAIGGLIFIASDFLIGLTEIRGVPISNANDWIWLTYIAGQMGIIYAAWAAG
ncbi:MAG TPA: lysoplasmalogenase [Terriglobales bacterium]|nr:lysoplasmalogenase [Terriglobales bacterium]